MKKKLTTKQALAFIEDRTGIELDRSKLSRSDAPRYYLDSQRPYFDEDELAAWIGTKFKRHKPMKRALTKPLLKPLKRS